MFTTARPTLLRSVVGAFGTVIFAGICLAGATAPAAAAEVGARTTLVSYSDLNLANAKARSTLDARIRSAAHKVCNNGGGDLRARADEARCIATAISQVTKPALTAVASSAF